MQGLAKDIESFDVGSLNHVVPDVYQDHPDALKHFMRNNSPKLEFFELIAKGNLDSVKRWVEVRGKDWLKNFMADGVVAWNPLDYSLYKNQEEVVRSSCFFSLFLVSNVLFRPDFSRVSVVST